ncbi:hypothetical protein cypCar_00042356, partial [Cyprinus carpio]
GGDWFSVAGADRCSLLLAEVWLSGVSVDGNVFNIYIDEKKQCYKDLGFKRQVQKEFVETVEIFCKVEACLSSQKVEKRFCCILSRKRPQTSYLLRTSALGISVNVQAGEKPQVKQEEFVRSSLFDTGI